MSIRGPFPQARQFRFGGQSLKMQGNVSGYKAWPGLPHWRHPEFTLEIISRSSPLGQDPYAFHCFPSLVLDLSAVLELPPFHVHKQPIA